MYSCDFTTASGSDAEFALARPLHTSCDFSEGEEEDFYAAFSNETGPASRRYFEVDYPLSAPQKENCAAPTNTSQPKGRSNRQPPTSKCPCCGHSSHEIPEACPRLWQRYAYLPQQRPDQVDVGSRDQSELQRVFCFGCGRQGHLGRQCPVSK